MNADRIGGFALLGGGIAFLVCAYAQQPQLRAELKPVRGEQTLTVEARAIQLPASVPRSAKRLGWFDWDRDGRPELFVGWSVIRPGCGNCDSPDENHVVVLRAGPGGRARTVQSITFEGDELLGLWFYEPPDKRDTPKVLAGLLGGATWTQMVLLRPGVSQVIELSGMNDDELVDLNGDGVYEYVAWDRRPNDKRCHFGLFSLRVDPEIHASPKRGFAKIWPRENAEWAQVMAQFAEIDPRGTVGMIALEDNGRTGPGTQRIALYRMRRASFDLLSTAAVQWPRIAVLIEVDNVGKTVDVRTATAKVCESGGNPEQLTRKTRYTFAEGRLRRAP